MRVDQIESDMPANRVEKTHNENIYYNLLLDLVVAQTKLGNDMHGMC